MVTFNVVNNSNTNGAGTKFVTGRFFDTYTITRSFQKFDLDGLGISLGDITAVELRIYITVINGGNNDYRLRSAIDTDDNWGAVLEANAADFGSTNANVETTDSLSSTGWHAWTVDKNNLDLSGINYYRIAITSENQQVTRNMSFDSEFAGTNPPVLRITTVSEAGLVRVIEINCS